MRDADGGSGGGTINDALREMLTWPVIVCAWHISRLWSLVHSCYNTGAPALWYYGHDVYVLSSLTSYMIAYVAEGVVFVAAIACRLYWDHTRWESSADYDECSMSISTSKMPSSVGQLGVGMMKQDGRLPALVHSESTVSTRSMMS